jgi:hypothetical protein
VNQVARTDSAPESPPAHSKGSSDRYPGPRSFDDNDVDRRLFFGRETEIDYLLHLVRATRMLVLFGKSGLGKTSLLQAGLYPRLREVALLPVPIRFNERGFNERDIRAREVVFAAVKVACETNEIDYVPASPDGLWEFFKTTDFWRDDVLVTPVLVFDQFEEIFTLQCVKLWRLSSESSLGEVFRPESDERFSRGTAHATATTRLESK